MAERLSDEDRALLRARVDASSAGKVAEQLGISRSTVLSILAGQGVHAGTALLVRNRLHAP